MTKVEKKILHDFLKNISKRSKLVANHKLPKPLRLQTSEYGDEFGYTNVISLFQVLREWHKVAGKFGSKKKSKG